MTTQIQNKRTQTSMLQLGVEPTTPVFDRINTVHTLDCAATVIGSPSFFNFERKEETTLHISVQHFRLLQSVTLGSLA
jgi:hypothetical protein